MRLSSVYRFGRARGCVARLIHAAAGTQPCDTQGWFLAGEVPGIQPRLAGACPARGTTCRCFAMRQHRHRQACEPRPVVKRWRGARISASPCRHCDGHPDPSEVVAHLGQPPAAPCRITPPTQCCANYRIWILVGWLRPPISAQSGAFPGAPAPPPGITIARRPLCER